MLRLVIYYLQSKFKKERHMAISPKTSTISLKKKLTPKHLEKTFNTVDAYFVIIILGPKLEEDDCRLRVVARNAIVHV